MCLPGYVDSRNTQDTGTYKLHLHLHTHIRIDARHTKRTNLSEAR